MIAVLLLFMLLSGVPRPEVSAPELSKMLSERVVPSGECLVWTGGRDSGGYGLFRHQRMHRVAWELANGPIPSGMFVCHHCDNPPCVRLDHLFLGTPRDNVTDMWAKGRGVNRRDPARAECHRGHPMTGENVIPATPRHACQCRTCHTIRNKARHAVAS